MTFVVLICVKLVAFNGDFGMERPVRFALMGVLMAVAGLSRVRPMPYIFSCWPMIDELAIDELAICNA